MADNPLEKTGATDKPFTGLKVLVTRPAHQAQALCDMIHEQGGEAVSLPVIEIVPYRAQMPSFQDVDYAVFISPNAVSYGLPALGDLPKSLKLVTIGQASADKLLELSGRAADIMPQGQYNSETLLTHPELQQERINNKKIVIFRGVGGRELLATELRARGAQVSYAEVYQRRIPDYTPQAFKQLWLPAADIISLTSYEGLRNLHQLCLKYLDNTQLQQLWSIPLVVVTEKMRHYAQQLGFTAPVLIAEKAGNYAILDALLDYARHGRYWKNSRYWNNKK